MTPTAHCPRCKSAVPVEVPWPGFRILRIIWIVMSVLLVGLAPIILSEITLLLPLLCHFALAAGTLWAEAGRKPMCRLCKLELPRSSVRMT